MTKEKTNLAELVENAPDNTIIELEPGHYVLDRKIDLRSGKSIKSKEKGEAIIIVDDSMAGNVWDWVIGDNTPGQFIEGCCFEYASEVIL